MKYCKNCLTTDLRPGGEIKDGLCFPCLHIESTKSNPTRTKLIELKEKYRISRIGQKNHLLFASIFRSICSGIAMDLGSRWDQCSMIFECVLHHFFEHGFCIDLSSIAGWNLVYFLIVL